MANPILCSTLRQLIYLSVAPSTRRTYKSGETSFLNFCTTYNIPPYPASLLTLQFFCAHLATNVSYKTIKVYLAGIRLAHLERGHADLTDNEPLRLLIRGVRHLQGESSRHRLPITIAVLHSLKHQLRISNLPLLEQRLLWAAFTIAFYSFLCVSEFTSSSLQWSDIQFTPKIISVTIRQSKTDPFRKGHILNLTPTGTSTCPVKAFQQFATMIPLHRQTGPLFSAGRFNPLTRLQLSRTLRQLLQQAGYNPQIYCTHSFRIGATTTSAAAGIPPWLIKTLGRWNSDAYLTYVQTPTALI